MYTKLTPVGIDWASVDIRQYFAPDQEVLLSFTGIPADKFKGRVDQLAEQHGFRGGGVLIFFDRDERQVYRIQGQLDPRDLEGRNGDFYIISMTEYTLRLLPN